MCSNVYRIFTDPLIAGTNRRPICCVLALLQVAICEPVEVDDNGDIFERQRIKGTDRIFVR